MLELRWIDKMTPKGWKFDVGDVIKIAAAGGRLDSLEVSSHVVPKLAGCVRQKSCNKLVFWTINSNSVQGKICAGSRIVSRP